MLHSPEPYNPPHPCQYSVPLTPQCPLPKGKNKSGETASKICFKSSSRARAGVLESLGRSWAIGPRSLLRYDYMRFLLSMEGRCGVEAPSSTRKLQSPTKIEVNLVELINYLERKVEQSGERT
jgi:hypothetical protein